MLRKGVSLAVVGLLLFSSTNAMKIRRAPNKDEFVQVREPESTDPPAGNPTDPQPTEPVDVPLNLTEDQIQDFRKECGAYIDRWLEEGTCTEEQAAEYRESVNQRSLSYYEGELELFENAVENCRDENRYYREFVAPRRTNPPVQEPTNPVPEPSEDPTSSNSVPTSDDEEINGISDEKIQFLIHTCQDYIDDLLEEGQISEEEYEESEQNFETIYDLIIRNQDWTLYNENVDRCNGVYDTPQ
ncbi:UNKNOWN [Stylonychia lemnae]|uniref:Uncharacterized protein n=1 Tax=Stylonychia lemnae TaxID=5949 RepID=A0A078AXC0_STYLE|nr:UNKNOWN [Stylonychia lemnae]|eukprot:CDW86721.1 UNKNOWN [Stylonychia lemnae]